MNKVELAKMLGLEWFNQDGKGIYDLHEFSLKDCFKHDWFRIEGCFNSGIHVRVTKEDFAEDKLDIKLSDLETEADIKACIKKVEDFFWKQAAERYLNLIREAAHRASKSEYEYIRYGID